jgi:hypothetical protein
VADSGEQDNETSEAIKFGEFLGKLRNSKLFKKQSAQGVS